MGTELFLPGGKSPQTDASKTQSLASQNLFGQAGPLRGMMFGQLLEGLRTGGIQAQIPIIQRSVEQSRAATSSGLRSLDEQIGQAGVAGTPFAQGLRSQQLMQGRQAESMVPTNTLRSFLSMAPGMVSNASQTGMQGLSSVTASEAQVRNAQIAAVSQILSQAIATGEKAACWIAAAIYGKDSYEYWLARGYIFSVWTGPIARIVKHLYWKYGERLARYPWVCKLAKPFIDTAIRRMQRRLAWAQS